LVLKDIKYCIIYKPEKRVGMRNLWDKSENILEKVIKRKCRIFYNSGEKVHFTGQKLNFPNRFFRESLAMWNNTTRFFYAISINSNLCR
jgi:threonyl-tRNA synthetase